MNNPERLTLTLTEYGCWGVRPPRMQMCEKCRELLDPGVRKFPNGSIEVRLFCRKCGDEHGPPLDVNPQDVERAARILMPLKHQMSPEASGYATNREFYEAHLQSDYWKALCKQRFEMDGHRCVLCNAPEQLTGHHRTYERLGHELISDITTLCWPCHQWYHARDRSGLLTEFIKYAGISMAA